MTDLGDHLHYFQEFERLIRQEEELFHDWCNSCSREESEAIIVKQQETEKLLIEVRARMHRYLEIEDLIADMNRVDEDEEDDEFID